LEAVDDLFFRELGQAHVGRVEARPRGGHVRAFRGEGGDELRRIVRRRVERGSELPRRELGARREGLLHDAGELGQVRLIPAQEIVQRPEQSEAPLLRRIARLRLHVGCRQADVVGDLEEQVVLRAPVWRDVEHVLPQQRRIHFGVNSWRKRRRKR